MRRHIKNSCFVLHRGIQIPGNKKSTRASVSCFHLFRGVWISQWSNSRSFLIHYFPVPRNAATSKIGNGVSSSLWQLRCHCNPDHNFFSSLSNTAVEVIFPNSYRAFSLTWLTSMQIYWNKRKRLHKKRVQLQQDWFWDTNMAAVLLFFDTNMAAVTSCENTLLMATWFMLKLEKYWPWRNPSSHLNVALGLGVHQVVFLDFYNRLIWIH